jgi:large subunit ribosomal protein L1
MKEHSKRFTALMSKVEKKQYSPEEAISALKEVANARFDETVNLSINLGIDVKKLAQPVRGSVNLPFGSGKKVRVLVFAQGEHVEKAMKAGADYVGGVELVEKIKGGWLDFEAVVATPDMMKNIAPLGKILGPRGLMPNPKMGTVTFEVEKIIGELKKGRIEFKMDKDGNIHMPVGKASFSKEQLLENLNSALRSVINAKPSGTKGVYIRSVHISATMSPSFPINAGKILQEIKPAVS